MPRKNVRSVPDPLLTIREVADWLRINLPTVRRLADSGALRTYRIGLRGDRRFSVKDVEEYLQKQPRRNFRRRKEDRWLSVREASLRLGVHPNTLRRWANNGQLKAKRIGTLGERRFSEQEVERYLQSRRSPRQGSIARHLKGASAGYLVMGGIVRRC